jgi:metal-responsive CopG/Arc/MetJ family transcriptional regulator
MMTKKIIQVPVDENLLKRLDYFSVKQNKARAEVIREACQSYLAAIETEDLERQYKEGYERIPESIDAGKAQEAMLSEILPEESW